MAILFDIKDAKVYYGLGYAYMKTGSFKESLTNLRRYLKSEADDGQYNVSDLILEVEDFLRSKIVFGIR